MIKGIDISKWQGVVDFKKVKASGIEFVILREGSGQTIDSRFLEYAKGCAEAGIPVLAIYHFAYSLSKEDAIEEAKICVKNAHAAWLTDVPIFYDFEYDTVDKARTKYGVVLDKNDCIAHTIAFCSTIEDLGHESGFYCNKDFYKNWYDLQTIGNYNVWLADYSGDADYACSIQQYSSKGAVPGINGFVDLNYLFDMTLLNRDFKMDKVKYSRQAVVNLARSWIGLNEADGSFKSIIDIYNSYTGQFPRGTKMLYSYAWCACFWSALAIKLGYTAIMPIEISCGYLIDAAKAMDCWIESDDYAPFPGDAILYDWDDSGKGDNVSWPDHVGVVESYSEESGYIVVIEGNYENSVKRRTISRNGRFIRGFIIPNYDPQDAEYVPEVKPKDIDTVAHEVIAGLWGNGEDRKDRLEEAGYDYSEIQKRVNEILSPEPKKQFTSTCKAQYFDRGLAGSYETTADLHLRNDAGTNKKSLVVIPKGTTVKNYGYYNVSSGTKWLYIEAYVAGDLYTGFSSAKYLKAV